jgi:hypothetical protein
MDRSAATERPAMEGGFGRSCCLRASLIAKIQMRWSMAALFKKRPT